MAVPPWKRAIALHERHTEDPKTATMRSQAHTMRLTKQALTLAQRRKTKGRRTG